MANVRGASRIVSSVCSAFPAGFGQRLEHDPEKKIPVFGKDHAPTKGKAGNGGMGQNSPVSLTVAVPSPISFRVARVFQVPRPLLRPAGAVNTQHPTERSRSGTIRAPESNTRTRTMFAVIRTGGKQYRVAAEDVIKVEKVKGDPGEIVQFGEVLVVGGDDVTLGVPTIAGASVAAEVLEQGRGAKVIAFKKRRRKNSRRKRGHRQEFTLLRVTEILTDGAKPTVTARPKPERKPKPVVAASEDDDDAEESAAPKAKAAKKPAKAAAKNPAAKADKPKSGAKGKKK